MLSLRGDVQQSQFPKIMLSQGFDVYIQPLTLQGKASSTRTHSRRRMVPLCIRPQPRYSQSEPQ